MTVTHLNLAEFSQQRRDRAVILAALALLTALAWTYLFYDAHRMTAGLCEMCMPLAHAWSARELALVFVMWTIMMIGMMTPSVAPAVLLFASLNRQRRAAARPFVPTIAFLAGYLLVWTLFSLAITLLQAWLHRAALLSPAMVSRSPLLGGALLIAAGLFQWLPIKNLCLRHCRSPMDLFLTHWREGAIGAIRMGFDHGRHCLTCCWLLMVLLFVAGVMNLAWIAAITLFVLLEKLIPTPWISRLSGAALCAGGTWLIVKGG
jgi:predicted metal-binding membrane protein